MYLKCMKKIIVYLIHFSLTLICFAQDGISWKISHDKKQLFFATEENPDSNSITLSTSDFKEKGCYTISYAEENTATQRMKWIRTIAVYDEKDNELYKKQSATVKITDIVMKKLLTENKTIKIYTWSLPKDPAEAARIRIRRVHLCTIVFR